MARNYERDEREGWRRQQQNRDYDYGWGHRQEDRNWREDQEMAEGNRGQGMPRGWDRGNEGRPAWQGGQGGGWQGDRWQGGDYQSSRGNDNRQWEGDREMESRAGRNDWNRGMGGGWSPNAERWKQGNWNQGMHGQHAGRGPRSYKRQDDRIEEDINEQLTRHSMIDATDIEVSVQNGEVTMRGHVENREAKRMAEDIAESCFGVKEVNNQIKIKHHGEGEERRERRAS
ncbi:MAG TPA: BON domain-containing protein [Terriglobia bacterium]|jgi:hypothetical protein